MNKYAAAVIAAFVATVVLSVMMLIKGAMGVLPQLDIAAMLATMMGSPGSIGLGWLAHFVIGTVGYGVAFAVLAAAIPVRSPVAKGVVLGLAGWLMMMIVVMPMAGAGLFALNIGIAAAVMTAVLHVVFGAVLGWVFQALRGASGGRIADRA